MANDACCKNGCCPADACRCMPGTFKDAVTAVPEEQRLPTVNMPKAPDPSPFTLGTMTPGGRSE